MPKVSALFITQRDNGKRKCLPVMVPPHPVTLSPVLIGHANGQSLSMPRDDGLSLCEIFKVIAQKRVCVLRRAGSDVDQQVSSLIASAFRAIGREPPTGGSSATVHFLTVDHHCAGKMLDRMGRQGLPLIFLNGDCVGGLTELKRLMSKGFLTDFFCAHDFDLAVIGCGEGNSVAERAAEEAVKLGKRVALVEVRRNSGKRGRHDSFVNAQIARQTVNQTALMRHSIEEAQRNGWTVDCSAGDGKINFGLDWRYVREVIEQKTTLKRERTEREFQKGKVQVFSATACHFFGPHQLTFCQQMTDFSDSPQNKLAKLSADKFLLVPKSEAKALENVPGAKEFCISNDELFCLEHNPGKTLFFCDDETDPQVLESAAILKALGNEVTIMSNSYSPGRRAKGSARLECFDSELIASTRDSLCQLGVRFLISLPTKFEQLKEAADGKSPILRVYATNAWDKSAPKGSAGEWTPFVEEFNTVVVSVGRRSHLADGLLLDNLMFGSSNLPNSSPISDSTNCTMNGTTAGRRMSSSYELLQAPNIYAIGDLRTDRRWRGETTPQEQTEERNWQRAHKMLRKMYEAEFETMGSGGDLPIVVRTIQMPPVEYACCGLNEAETEAKWGRHLIHVYRDEEVPIVAERAKMICVKEAHQKRECIVGLHLISPKASQVINGYALAMKMGLTKCQMELDSWHRISTVEK